MIAVVVASVAFASMRHDPSSALQRDDLGSHLRSPAWSFAQKPSNDTAADTMADGYVMGMLREFKQSKTLQKQITSPKAAVAAIAGTLFAVLLIVFFVWGCVCKGAKRSQRDPKPTAEDFTGGLAPIEFNLCPPFPWYHKCEVYLCTFCMRTETAVKACKGSDLSMWAILFMGSLVLFFTEPMVALLILPESWDDLNLSDVEEPLAIAAAAGGIVLLAFSILGCMLRSKLLDVPAGKAGQYAFLNAWLLSCFCVPCSNQQEAEFVETYQEVHPEEAKLW